MKNPRDWSPLPLYQQVLIGVACGAALGAAFGQGPYLGGLRNEHLGWLGMLVAVSGFGYLVDGFGTVLQAGYHLGLARFTFVGEILLMIWLLWRGRRLTGPFIEPVPTSFPQVNGP